MINKAHLGAFLARNPFSRGWTDGLFYREKMRAIFRVAPDELAQPGRILEIGGGRSGLASILYPTAQVTTVDLNPELGRQIPSWAQQTFACADARQLPFPNNCFDIVTLFDVLEHIEDDKAAALEALRVTRVGGLVLVSTPHVDWRYPYYTFLKACCPDERELFSEWGHVRRGYRIEDLSALFGQTPIRTATFINPVTAFAHDISFSRLKRRWRMLIYLLVAPITFLGYVLHRPDTRGTEIALSWRK